MNARWMESLHGFLHVIEWILFHGFLGDFQKPPLGGRPETKPEDRGTLNAHNRHGEDLIEWTFFEIAFG